MYSKEELQAKSVVQLKDIAKELGVKVKTVSYTHLTLPTIA